MARGSSARSEFTRVVTNANWSGFSIGPQISAIRRVALRVLQQFPLPASAQSRLLINDEKTLAGRFSPSRSQSMSNKSRLSQNVSSSPDDQVARKATDNCEEVRGKISNSPRGRRRVAFLSSGGPSKPKTQRTSAFDPFLFFFSFFFFFFFFCLLRLFLFFVSFFFFCFLFFLFVFFCFFFFFFVFFFVSLFFFFFFFASAFSSSDACPALRRRQAVMGAPEKCKQPRRIDDRSARLIVSEPQATPERSWRSPGRSSSLPSASIASTNGSHQMSCHA